jgi:hypothetical protein
MKALQSFFFMKVHTRDSCKTHLTRGLYSNSVFPRAEEDGQLRVQNENRWQEQERSGRSLQYGKNSSVGYYSMSRRFQKGHYSMARRGQVGHYRKVRRGQVPLHERSGRSL